MRAVICVAGLMVAGGSVRADDAAPGVAAQAVATEVSSQVEAKVVERYYVVELSGQRAGQMRSVQRTADGRIVTETAMAMKLARGEVRVEIAMAGGFEETPDGKPLAMRSEQKLGQMMVTTASTFADGKITTITTQGEVEREAEVEIPADWLPPAAMEREVKRQFLALLADETLERKIVVRTMDPLGGASVMESVRTGFTREEIEVLGKDGKEKVQAYKVLSSISNMPGVQSIEWVDSEGEMLRSQTNVGGMQVTLVRSDRETVLGRKGAKASREVAQIPEIMLSTFVKPDRRIANPRELAEATYLLRSTSEDALAKLGDIPSTGQQCAERVDARTVRVRVATRALCEGDVPAEKDRAKFLASTTLADASDKAVREIGERALAGKGLTDPAAIAEALRLGVREAIAEKSLGVGFATASEVARTKEGDCTEHAVLLAAVLRASGIPSRAVTGLVYADQFAGQEHIFGYHMWAQALLPDAEGKLRWVDLDAALPGGGFDATHIALGVTDLADADSMRTLVAVAGFLGQVGIEVEAGGE